MGAGKPYFTAKSHIQTLETERLGGRNKKASIQNGRNFFFFFFPERKPRLRPFSLCKGRIKANKVQILTIAGRRTNVSSWVLICPLGSRFPSFCSMGYLHFSEFCDT